MKSNPGILKREIKEGHEIANHTYHHYYDKNMTAEVLSSELDKTDKVIWDIAKYKPTLYRPVGGLHNDIIINTAVKKDSRLFYGPGIKIPKTGNGRHRIKYPPTSYIRYGLVTSFSSTIGAIVPKR